LFESPIMRVVAADGQLRQVVDVDPIALQLASIRLLVRIDVAQARDVSL
jgi:hypothetical protein